jgi:putative transposase
MRGPATPIIEELKPGWPTMKASRFSEAQKAFLLKQGADGMPVADICRKVGISQATYFNWKKYDGLLPTEMRRLKQVEDENAKLRKVVADHGDDRLFVAGVIVDVPIVLVEAFGDVSTMADMDTKGGKRA